MAMRRSARAVFQQMWLPNPLGEAGGSDPVANDCFRRDIVEKRQCYWL
jgi:hypothetical protein